jgi:hypothetical protein
VTEGSKYDLYSADFFADAYATFGQMRLVSLPAAWDA